MGYYTCHTLDVKLADNSAEHPDKYQIIASLRAENEEAACSFDEEGQTLSNSRWYESSDEMKEFSKKHPDALFVMDGDGEESDDFWIAYYLDGKEQTSTGRIEYDEFDPTKLE